jgi:hypothetical protein
LANFAQRLVNGRMVCTPIITTGCDHHGGPRHSKPAASDLSGCGKKERGAARVLWFKIRRRRGAFPVVRTALCAAAGVAKNWAAKAK